MTKVQLAPSVNLCSGFSDFYEVVYSRRQKLHLGFQAGDSVSMSRDVPAISSKVHGLKKRENVTLFFLSNTSEKMRWTDVVIFIKHLSTLFWQMPRRILMTPLIYFSRNYIVFTDFLALKTLTRANFSGLEEGWRMAKARLSETARLAFFFANRRLFYLFKMRYRDL